MTDLNHLLRSNIKFKHLQLVLAMNELRHVGKVAELVHLSQPAISKSLAEIELIIGAKLFERSSRGLITTASGDLFVQFARETLSRLDRVAEDFATAQLGMASTIHIGLMMTATALLIPMTVALLKEKSPTTKLRVDDGLMEPLLERLNLGQIDMVIGRINTIPDRTGLILEELYQDAVVIVAGRDSPLAQRDALEWNDLASQPWILPPPGTSARHRFDVASMQRGYDQPKDLVETSSFLAMVALIRERGTISMMSEALARYCETLQIVKILPIEPIYVGPIGIVQLADRQMNPGVALFSECLRLAAQKFTPAQAPRSVDLKGPVGTQ